ncbi:hypothetical protein BGX28_008804 [Mortierella sp. GBA30]|nr:hypothetical protein BGX28_008804 [Mortierella sp. GBA30]
MVASVCVDYLSHPLSAEHLLVCYQQITRQIAHAPQSAKDAAISFQHQSQALLELLGPQHQHQNLAIPKAKERPAPVGCKSQLRRMQNALWRRSSQSSLAKDVALVRPESLNWQKECDVLWLYGPLYKVDIPEDHPLHHKQQRRRLPPKQTQASEWEQEQLELVQDQARHQLNQHEREHLAAAASVFESPPESPKSETADPVAILLDSASSPSSSPAAPSSCATTTITTTTTEASSVAVAESLLAVAPITTALSSSETALREDSQSSTTVHLHLPTPESSILTVTTTPSSVHPLAAVDTLTTSTSSTDLSSTATARATAAANGLSSAVVESPFPRPQKSALKQQRTRMQTFEELRAYTHSPQYLALCNFLALPIPPHNHSFTDGSRSEPMSPTLVNGSGEPSSSSTFMLPIFPAPTKYHFRSHDRRRASFPKSSSHSFASSGQLNANVVDLSMGVCNIQELHRRKEARPICSGKQLRFSLEVQELIFLPTSPPFRISRAKPTRAHSDPAIHSSTCSSYIAPSQDHSHPQAAWPCPQEEEHEQKASSFVSSNYSGHGQRELISSATTNYAVDNASTATSLKIQKARDGKSSSVSSSSSTTKTGSSKHRRRDENVYFEDDFFLDDEYRFDDFSESNEDDEDDDEEEEEEEEEISGRRNKRSGHQSRFRFASTAKDAIVRRVHGDHHPNHQAHATPGVLWQVYTAVTGVKELIAWYGSMVYHSSSL